MNGIREFLSCVEIYDFDQLTKVRIGNKDGDGGYVALAELCEQTDIVYSCGVGADVSFEMDFINRFPDVNAIKLFDPTIDSLPVVHPKFRFFKKDASGMAFEWPVIYRYNGFVDRFAQRQGNYLLKMDIEWDEWRILPMFLDVDLARFSQILVELHIIHAQPRDDLTPYFHGLYHKVLGKINDDLFGLYAEVLKKLTAQFYIFHIHANNSLPKANLGEFSFPPLLELSLVRRDLVSSGYQTTGQFPVEELDVPNKSDRPDIIDFYPLIKG